MLSFVLERSEQSLEGEVVVSAETALACAARYKSTPEDELLRYVIHGTLHLVGYDDATPRQRAAMRRKERKYLRGELVGHDAAALGPGSQTLDVLAHHDRKRLRRLDGGKDVLGGAFRFVGERRIQAGDHRLLDFGAAEALRGGHQTRQVEVGLVAVAASSGGSRRSPRAPRGPGKSTKKISSNRPLRINSGGSWVRLFAVAIRKIGCAMVLHPRQQRAEHPLRQSAVGRVAAGRGERLFDLVDPQDDRRHRLGLLQGLAEPGLALADVLLIEHAGVHPHQRHPPGRGHDLRAEALAAALHAQQQDAPRRIEAELAGPRPKSRRAAC